MAFAGDSCELIFLIQTAQIKKASNVKVVSPTCHFFTDSKNVRFSRFLSFFDKINQSVRVFSELRSQRIAVASCERLSCIRRMSADSSPIVSPVFTARQWNAGNQSDFRRSPAARATASMLSQPSCSSGLFDSCPAQEDAECIKCSPPFRGGVLQSPLGKLEDCQDTKKSGTESLRANAWLSPLIRSPVNDRFYTGLQLAQMQACPRYRGRWRRWRRHYAKVRVG